MKKSEWIEYFEAIHDRLPSEEEIAKALEEGTFEAEDQASPLVDQPEEVSPVATEPSPVTPVPVAEPAGPSPILVFLKKYKLALAALAFLFVGAMLIKNFLDNRPHSIIDQLEVTFEGYNGEGEAVYDSSAIELAIIQVALEEAGFSKKEVDKLMESIMYGFNEKPELLDLPKNQTKWAQAQDIYDTVSWDLTATEGLSNGDKVTLKVEPEEDSPFKAEEKTFTVSGLEDFTILSTADLLEQYPIRFMGFNGYGVIDAHNSTDVSTYFGIDTYGQEILSNGDSLELRAQPYLIDELKENGEKLESEVFEITVEGLKEISSISNLEEGFKKIETYAKAQNKNTNTYTYELEKVDSYTKPYISYDASLERMSLATIYKVTKKKEGSDDVVTYYRYGYHFELQKDGSLDMTTAQEDWSPSNSNKDSLVQGTESDGFSKY